jgi:hypothetical protein
MPTNVQSDVIDRLSELDGFLLKWVMEDTPSQWQRAPAALSHTNIEVEELLHQLWACRSLLGTAVVRAV